MKHHNVKFRFIILEYIILKVPVLRGTYANNYEILHRLSFPIIRCHRYGCNTCYGGKYTSFLNDQPTDNDYAFLGNCSLKMIYCDAIEITSSEAGTDYGSIVFRLCPSTGECIDDFGSVGCDAGYGDFLVGIEYNLHTSTYRYSECRMSNVNRKRNLTFCYCIPVRYSTRLPVTGMSSRTYTGTASS